MPLVEKELPTLPRTWVHHWFLVGFVLLRSLCPFSFGHCVACPSSFGHCVACPSSFGHCVACPSSFGHCVACPSSNYGFWLPFGICKLFLEPEEIINGCCHSVLRATEIIQISDTIRLMGQVWNMVLEV
jgi:hypothetical protein